MNETPQTSSWYGTNNRIVGWGYDSAGNLTSVSGMSRSFSYDAENRQKTATVNSQSSTYSYDADGRRVQSVTPSGTTVYLYGVDGALAAEYSTAANPLSGTRYVTSDHLGSTRLVTTAAGVADKSFDYLPFGDELLSGTAGRGSTFPTAGYPHAPTGNSIEFTGKERDSETGLDYFGARYFSGAQGRFTSPDVPLVDQRAQDPQSWNLYSYGRNNPLKYTDPTGRCSKASGGYTDEGSELFSGPCSGGQIGEQKAGGNSVTVGVGRDEANLIMLQGIGNAFTGHAVARFVSDAAQATGRLTGAN